MTDMESAEGQRLNLEINGVQRSGVVARHWFVPVRTEPPEGVDLPKGFEYYRVEESLTISLDPE